MDRLPGLSRSCQTAVMQNRIILAVLLALAACGKPTEHEPVEPTDGAAAATAPATETATSTAAAAPASRYTSLKQCKVTRSAPAEDWSESRCDGVGGWALQLDYGDLRETVQLLRAGRPPLDLNLGALTGGAFNSVGDAIEWRAPGVGQPPAALILRNSVSEDVNQPERLTAYLVVADLAQGCVVANVRPSADQNAAARAVADGPRRACLKP
jgi:hypothetical protein